MNIFILREESFSEPESGTSLGGAYSSLEKAIEQIKLLIGSSEFVYLESRFVVEEWSLDGERITGHYFTRNDNLRFAKEIGILK